ncbi:hypothetical protein MuYL_2945 [Mucilaginibacter xinganensis]|uniref:Uncharacterized protein n=1 Tax=Mucilaginibacter xinganensis TaxID=1234841 RepID=A0A223NY97_9SPHI|nr:hypothetical protein MuYL_2945 [Mucilaginibacter xinganensis]
MNYFPNTFTQYGIGVKDRYIQNSLQPMISQLLYAQPDNEDEQILTEMLKKVKNRIADIM